RAREGQDGRALHPRRPRHEPAADPRARRGPLRAAAAEDPFAALVRVSGRRRLGARRADHGPRAAGEPRRRADVGEAHVLLERQGGARARLRVARPGRGRARRDRLVRRERLSRQRRPRPGGTMSGEHSMHGKARARANIALVKYWGKADERLKIPAVGSISITLDGLWSETDVRFDPALSADQLELDGRSKPEQLARVSACLDLVRSRAGVDAPARVISRNNFPTGAGLASSASGFAALVGAASAALGLELTPRELSIYARRGSGSAARSVF